MSMLIIIVYYFLLYGLIDEPTTFRSQQVMMQALNPSNDAQRLLCSLLRVLLFFIMLSISMSLTMMS